MSEIFQGRIKEIVKGSDLATLSSKKIRKQLEEEFKTDLSTRKKEIDDIVMGLLISDGQSEQSQSTANDDEDDDNDHASPVPKKDHHKKKKKSRNEVKSSNSHKKKQVKDEPNVKKTKRDSSEESDEEVGSDTAKDAKLARMLQDEADSDDCNVRGLRMRGCRMRRKTTKPPKPAREKKPTAKRESLFNRDMVLSPELADILGSNRMPRSEVIQKMWQIIKERDLKDPRNGQFHICDEQLMTVFGVRRVRTFGMMKYLKSHVKDPLLLTNDDV